MNPLWPLVISIIVGGIEFVVASTVHFEYGWLAFTLIIILGALMSGLMAFRKRKPTAIDDKGKKIKVDVVETEKEEEAQKLEEKEKKEEKKEKVWSLAGLIGSIVGLAWFGAIFYILWPQQIQMMWQIDHRPFLMLILIGLALVGMATLKKKGLSWGLGVLMILPIMWMIAGGHYYSKETKSAKESVSQAIRVIPTPDLKKEPYLKRRLDLYTNIPFWTTYDVRFSKGDIVVFKDPKGEFSWDPQVKSTTGASGASWIPNQISRPQDFKVRDFNIVGLIGDIDGQIFGIGKGVSIEILKGGALKLAINERWKQYCWNDNSEGPISILVEVYRQQS